MRHIKLTICDNQCAIDEVSQNVDIPLKEKIEEIIVHINFILNLTITDDILHLSIFEMYVRYEKVIDSYIDIMLKTKLVINEKTDEIYEIYTDQLVSEFIFKNGIISRDQRNRLIAITPQLERLKACSQGKSKIEEARCIRDYVAHLSPKAQSDLNRALNQNIKSIDELNDYLKGRGKGNKIRSLAIIEEFKKFVKDLFYL